MEKTVVFPLKRMIRTRTEVEIKAAVNPKIKKNLIKNLKKQKKNQKKIRNVLIKIKPAKIKKDQIKRRLEIKINLIKLNQTRISMKEIEAAQVNRVKKNHQALPKKMQMKIRP